MNFGRQAIIGRDFTARWGLRAGDFVGREAQFVAPDLSFL